MKTIKNLLIATAIIFVSLTSCKKGDEPTPSDKNKINDTTYRYEMYYLDGNYQQFNIDNSLKTVYISDASYTKMFTVGNTVEIYIYKNNVIEYKSFIVNDIHSYEIYANSTTNSETLKISYNHDNRIYNIQYSLIYNTNRLANYK